MSDWYYDPEQFHLTYASPVSYSASLNLKTRFFFNLEQWILPEADAVAGANINENYRPLYYTSDGSIQQMSLQDIDDTFIKPAIKYFVGETTPTDVTGSCIPYTVASTTTVNNYDRLLTNSGYPLLMDQTTDPYAYTDPASLYYGDGSYVNVSSYYVHKRKTYRDLYDQISTKNYTFVRFDSSTNSLIQYASTELAGILYPRFLYFISWVTNYRVRHFIDCNCTGVNSSTVNNNSKNTGVTSRAVGTLMVDTTLGGSSVTRSYKAGEDDYRYQVVPQIASSSNNQTFQLRIARY
jgi:hypothetical protein